MKNKNIYTKSSGYIFSLVGSFIMMTLLSGCGPGEAPAQPLPAERVPAQVLPLSVTLTNLTPIQDLATATATGDSQCTEQPYYRYFGGKADNFALPADPSYPSANAKAFFSNLFNSTAGVPITNRGYDASDVGVTSVGRVAESFNLQNSRSVCYAVIDFKVAVSGVPAGFEATDLYLGHTPNQPTNPTGGTTFFSPTPIVSVEGIPVGTNAYTFAFSPTGLVLLTNMIGGNVGDSSTPLTSVLDIYLRYLQKIDNFEMRVWYAPPISCVSTGQFPTC